MLALLESHRYSRWRAEGWAAIDIPPDQTRFATGNGEASVWDITTEERLLGILEHDTYDVRGVRFSLNVTRLATASTTMFASSTAITTKTYHTLLLPDHAACVVKQRGTNYCHIERQQSYVFRRVDWVSARVVSTTVESIILLAGDDKFSQTVPSRSWTYQLSEIGTVTEDSDDTQSHPRQGRNGRSDRLGTRQRGN